MRRFKTALLALWGALLGSVPLLAQQAAGGQQSEFVPVKELPPSDQLPAAPYLIAAYAFVWLALMWYLWSIWRRLGRVEREMEALQRRSADRSPAR